jgi:outer membrane receptor for ferrienterochelin and colicins
MREEEIMRKREGMTTALVALLLALWTPGEALAQTGSVAGTVRSADGEIVTGAEVGLTGTGQRASTGAQGNFRFPSVAPGTYQLRVFRIGFAEVRIEDVQVRAGEETRVDVTLETRPIALSDIVVSPGRRAQRQSEAPATVTRIDAQALGDLPGGTFANALREVKGLDFIQVGVSGVAINARGFNSSFNNRMLMMEDGRIAVLPESGLPLGGFTPIPQIDLASMEVLVGPGAALYGPDASSGVLSLESKDPREYPGTSVWLTGGMRGYQNAQARHAGASGDWGYKVTGEYHRVNDFHNTITYTANEIPETGVGGEVNWENQAIRGQGALTYYLDESRIELGVGGSRIDGVGQTNVGRNQFDGWTYNYAQLRFSSPNMYVNLYRTQSQSGDSYALNRFTENRAANPGPTDDEIRLMSDWPSDGRLWAAEIQNNFNLAPLRGTRVTWGAQLRRDVVSSDRQWLTDRLTGEDVTINQFGVYGQTETPITNQLNLVLAARVDEHDNYDTQFSPKAGLVWSPQPDHAVRFTYNRAFKSPTILQTNFWIPDFVPFVGVFHNTDGFVIRDLEGNVVHELEPLVPESNETFELGYRGVLNGRFLVDVAGYTGRYEDFMSPLTIFANPFGATIFSSDPTIAYWPDGTEVTGEAGGPQIPLTYWNLGDARVRGVDFGATLIVNPRVDLRSTFSYIGLSSEAAEAGPEREATALNSPSTKWTLGADLRDFGNFGGGATLRYVNGYRFLSGINQGRIPTHATLDVSLRYRIPNTGVRLNATAQNLFACGADEPGASRSCGLDERHIQMVNMPAIGTMVFLGIQWDL